MIAQGTAGHVVSTASAAGLGSRPASPPTAAAKHAVIVLSESLHHDLATPGSRLLASVLCPVRAPTAMMRRRLERARRCPLLAA